jgi:hypothetical protein
MFHVSLRVKNGSEPQKTSPDDSGRIDGSARMNLGLGSRQSDAGRSGVERFPQRLAANAGKIFM